MLDYATTVLGPEREYKSNMNDVYSIVHHWNHWHGTNNWCHWCH